MYHATSPIKFHTNIGQAQNEQYGTAHAEEPDDIAYE
jgi:hypothetical protein